MSGKKKNITVCRVCLTSNMAKCVSIFDKFRDNYIYFHINLIVNVEISEGDGLPDKICPPCLLDLETAINFKQKCESSNVILQSSTMNKQQQQQQPNVLIIKKEEIQEDDIEYQDQDAHLFDFSEYNAKMSDKPISETNLSRKTKASDQRLQCHDCGDYFKSKCKLRVHWKNIHLPRTLICQICKRTFKSIKAYENHAKRKQNSCIVASEVHIEGEGRSRIFYCKDCDYKSHRIKDLKTHLVVHSGDRPFQCDVCFRTFTQQSSLEGHKESVHKTYKIEITCQYCGKNVKGRRRVYRHLQLHKDTQVQCDICTKKLKSKKMLKVHMQRHSGVKSYTCEKCAKTFYTASDLCNHRRMIHDKGKYWYKCNQCEYKSIRSEAVNKHKLKHTSDNIPCTVCGMFFENKQKLMLHERRHFGEKKYKCPECDIKFMRRDSVRKHVRVKHMFTVLNNNKKSDALIVKEETPQASNHNNLVEIQFISVVQ